MGQARRRGDFETRKQKAIERNAEQARKDEEVRIRRYRERQDLLARENAERDKEIDERMACVQHKAGITPWRSSRNLTVTMMLALMAGYFPK